MCAMGYIVSLQVSDVLVVLHGDESSSKANPAILLTSGTVVFKQNAAPSGLSELVDMVKWQRHIHGNVNTPSCKDLLKEV
jgi:hypothetical protein